MVHHLTISLNTTHSGAWINAFISDTRLIWRAIGVQCTFWSTTFVWIAIIFWQTLTRAGAVLFSTHSVRWAWIWRARVDLIIMNWSFFDRTLNKWIANIASKAFANRCMTDNMTLGILATHSVRARIFAVSIDTSKVIGAFRTCHTLRSAIGSLTDEIRQAIASVTISINTAFSVRATRRAQTRVHIIFFNRRRRLFNFDMWKRVNRLIMHEV